MIRKILPILLTSLVGFSSNNFTHSPNNSVRYDFIDYDSPNYRLGDYHTFDIASVSAGGGQVRFTRIKAVIPSSVFDTLAEYENVFITIPNYRYNSAVDLVMRIEVAYSYVPVLPADYPYDELPLSESMLKVLPYTMLDIPYEHNVFDRDTWTNNSGFNFNIVFTIPYTKHTNPPSDYAEQLKNITLFTKRSDGYDGGYDNGYFDGFNDGYDNGYDGGYEDGYYWGDLDGYNRGINEDFNAYSYLFGMFGAFSGLFAVELLPGLTIGGIAILVLSLTLLPFLIGLFTKGGKK
jgi:hypothetical protein